MTKRLNPDMPYSKMVEIADSPDELMSDPIIEKKIKQLLKFFQETGLPYDKMDPDALKGTSLSEIEESAKRAYPNMDYFMHVPGQHDTQKWLETVKSIYYGERNGIDRISAIKKATQGWKVTETLDFLNWLKFYEEGSHMKYKFAQTWYQGDNSGYFFHFKQDPKKEEPIIGGKDIDMARDAIAEEMPVADKKHIIEKQRSKIIGRLDSAEKLLRTNEGQMFAGKEFESLLETIYQLKKKVQMVNKLSTSTKLYEDMIIREANVLTKNGFNKAAGILFSIAQANNPPPPGTGTTDDTPPLPTPAPAPDVSSGSPGGLPSTGPGMPQNPPDSAPNETEPTGIDEFLENMETGNIGTKDTQKSEDVLEVEDTEFVAEAQELPPPPMPSKPKGEAPIEVSEKDLGESPDKTVKDFDSMIDAAFSNIKISDVITKLDDLSKIFKTREIPRQLSIVDMMLDSLGIAAYFPSLSEATNKALESNNYIATRIDEILAKLQGSVEGRKVDLKGETVEQNPEVENIRQNLKVQDEKEKARKKMRKDQSNQELEMSGDSKETPNIDIEGDLSKIPPPKENKPAQPIQPVKPSV